TSRPSSFTPIIGLSTMALKKVNCEVAVLMPSASASTDTNVYIGLFSSTRSANLKSDHMAGDWESIHAGIEGWIIDVWTGPARPLLRRIMKDFLKERSGSMGIRRFRVFPRPIMRVRDGFIQFEA